MAKTFEERHRERKRKAEMEAAMNCLAPFLANKNDNKILEFGSGDGYQIPYLRRLGNVVASDICIGEEIRKRYPDVEFVNCDIRNSPFQSDNFDLVFSSHVLEHIKDVQTAFDELKRIGKRDCLHAFIVPTDIWLLFSLPAQCYNAVRKILDKNYRSGMAERKDKEEAEFKGWLKFLPRGHGWRKNFLTCFNSFKVGSWEKLFYENGFEVAGKTPILLYAPSEFPIIPTTRFLTRYGFCSSVIFILRKAA